MSRKTDKKMNDLYDKHSKSYDAFELALNQLVDDNDITDDDRNKLLILADDVVETNGMYSYHMGRLSVFRWLKPTWWYWRGFAKPRLMKEVGE